VGRRRIISRRSWNVLDALAKCFVDGKAQNEELRLVGHADPRGDEDYDFALGQRRAASVAEWSHRARASG
jgi:outer membrane protein OmpA-like peptidoglycan-associated protein